MNWIILFGILLFGYGVWLVVKIVMNRFWNASRTKNTTDFLLDRYILKLDANKVYRDYMHTMLIKNNAYEFRTVDNYADFQQELYLSLGGNLKHKKDYEIVVSMLLVVSNKYYWSAVKLLPSFLKALIKIRLNGLSIMENTMHMLTLHATSIGGYLSKSYDEEFISVLKKVRIVRENTGYIKGKQITFTRVGNPFLGSKVCPLANRHSELIFPPLADHHNYLNLKNFGNALGVIGTNNEEHQLDGKPLNDYPFMSDPSYWHKHFSTVKDNKTTMVM